MLTRHWRCLGLALDNADFADAQAMASMARITSGNFRLLPGGNRPHLWFDARATDPSTHAPEG